MAEIPEAAYQALLLAVSNARIRGSPGKEEPCAHLGEGRDLPCCIELRLGDPLKVAKRAKEDLSILFPSETRVKYC